MQARPTASKLRELGSGITCSGTIPTAFGSAETNETWGKGPGATTEIDDGEPAGRYNGKPEPLKLGGWGDNKTTPICPDVARADPTSPTVNPAA